MTHTESGKKRKRLTYSDRLKIEMLLSYKFKKTEIAAEIGCTVRTIQLEVHRGEYEHLNSNLTKSVAYSADIAETKNQENLRAKGGTLKIGKDHALANHIENKILNEGYSPYAVVAELAQPDAPKFETKITSRTIYNYIHGDVFLNLTTKNCIHRYEGKTRQYKKIVPVQKRAARGKSIEKRPEEIAERQEAGHWEMDCVVGKQKTKQALLVLTERKTRSELIFHLEAKTAANVVDVLNRIETECGESFRSIFKSITVDNGSEFADYAGMKRSLLTGDNRTEFFYCHPYSSYERGSNENLNKIVRRFFRKGTDFSNVTPAAVQKSAAWMNDYPRKILGGKTPMEKFVESFTSVLPDPKATLTALMAA